MSNCTLSITKEIQHLQLVTSIPTFILGLLGNIYVLAMFCRRPRNDWTYMMVYITNMAIADCVVLVILPVKMVSYESSAELWDYSKKELCFVLVSMYYVNMYVSIFTMTAISVVRYVAIRFPIRARDALSCRKALLVCALIWVTVCSLSAAFHRVDEPETNNTANFKCFQKNKEAELPLSFILVLSVVGFLAPLLIMAYCSAVVIHTLRKQLKIGSRPEKIQCICIITANLVVFVACFFPVHFGFLFKYVAQAHKHACERQVFAHKLVHGAMCVSIMNCGLDSFSYYFANKTTWNLCCLKQRREETCDYNSVS